MLSWLGQPLPRFSERLLCSRTRRVRGTNPPHPNTSNRAVSPHYSLTGQWGQTNRPRETARGPTPTLLNRAVGAHKSPRGNPPAGGCTDVETTHGGHQPRRVANHNSVNRHKTVTSRTSRPIKIMQPAMAPAPGHPIGEQSCSSTV